MPRGEHPRERLEADVEHRPVAAEAPQRPVLPAHLVPARAHAHRHRRGVLEQRVGPRHQVRVVRIRRGVDRVAAGGGDDAPLVAVLGAGGGAHHPQGRPFAAAGAAAGPADVDVRLLLEHHVDQQVVVDVPLVRRAELLEAAMALADRRSSTCSVLGIIFSAVSSQTVTHSAQPLHLLGSMMMANMPPFALLLGRTFVVLAGLRPLRARTSRGRPGRRSRPASASKSLSPSTLPRMAVSGQSVTQSMQPVQFSGMYSGISGAM